MKKTFITLFFILVILNAFSQVKCIEDATKKVVNQNSSKILEFIRLNSTKSSTKVLVLPFLYNNQADAWSNLIARNLAHEFQAAMQNKTDIIFYDESEFNNANTELLTATVTTTKNNYWDNLLKKFKPDFFIQGVYNRSTNSLGQESLELSLICISSYYYEVNTEAKKFVIDGSITVVIPQEDKMQQAKNDQNLWAEGKGSMLLKAEENAINNLIDKLAVNFSTTFDPNIAKSIAETYKPEIKKFAKTQIISEEAGDAQVIKYIELDILNRIYNDREIMIKEYITSGNKAEAELRISDALKNYYWALLLLQTHPQNNLMRADLAGQSNVLLIVSLPQIIRDILAAVKYETVRIIDNNNNSKTCELKITYKNQPVQNVEYKYWTGSSYSQIVRAQNGMGTIDLLGAEASNVNDLKIKTEYMFANKIAENAVITEIFNNLDLMQFNESKQNSQTSTAAQNNQVQNSEVQSNFKKAEDVVVQPNTQNTQTQGQLIQEHDYLGTVKIICDAITKNDKLTPKNYFTTEGYDMYQKLVEFGQAKVLNWNDQYKIIEINDRIMLRSVTMQFTFSNRTFIERVVFSFNKEGKVEALSFAVSDKTFNDIMNSDWDTYDKYEIIFFIEHYKTAFSLKRLDYLGQIFDENALIIVGHVAKKTEIPKENQIQIANQNIIYTQYTKKEYLDRLQTVFASNEYIYLNFQETSVMESKKVHHIYGVQIQQDYFSTYYADQGYLFLLIDLRDYKNPLIHVRTWQPEKNPDGSVFGLDDFYFD